MKKLYLATAILLSSVNASHATTPSEDIVALCQSSPEAQNINCACKADFLSKHLSDDEFAGIVSLTKAILNAKDKAEAEAIMREAYKNPATVSADKKMVQLDQSLTDACPDKK